MLRLSSCAQPAKVPSAQTDLAKVYSQAIGDFIKAANQKNGTAFDTLFIAKRQLGQADDFPDIELPEKIENTRIILITPEQGEKSQNERKTRIYINLFGWVEKEKAEFMFVVFSNGFDHQYDYTINYQCKGGSEAFELKKTEFKGPPFDK